MSSSVAVLCLLAAVLGEAVSLECVHCSSNTLNSCNGLKKVCSADMDQCIAMYTESNIQTVKLMQFNKSCGVIKDCNQTQHMTFNLTSFYRASKCCNTSNCNPDPVPSPPAKREANANSCPFCNEKAEKCKTAGKVTCLGDETRCINYTYAKMEGDKKVFHSLAGCANELMCTSKQDINLHAELNTTTKVFECSGASSILSSLLLLTVSSLLFLKLHS